MAGRPGSAVAPVVCQTPMLRSDGRVVTCRTIYKIQVLEQKEMNSFIFHQLPTSCLFTLVLKVSNLCIPFTPAGICRVLKFLELYLFILPENVSSKHTILLPFNSESVQSV